MIQKNSDTGYYKGQFQRQGDILVGTQCASVALLNYLQLKKVSECQIDRINGALVKHPNFEAPLQRDVPNLYEDSLGNDILVRINVAANPSDITPKPGQEDRIKYIQTEEIYDHFRKCSTDKLPAIAFNGGEGNHLFVIHYKVVEDPIKIDSDGMEYSGTHNIGGYITFDGLENILLPRPHSI